MLMWGCLLSIGNGSLFSCAVCVCSDGPFNLDPLYLVPLHTLKTSGWLSQACRHSIKSKTPLTGWGLKVGGREAYLHFNVAISQI